MSNAETRSATPPSRDGLEEPWIAHQHDVTRKFYCRVNHLLEDEGPQIHYGANRITEQDFKNLEREGMIQPPISCALTKRCVRLLYAGKRIVLKTGPGELFEPFVVWVDDKKERGFINRNDVEEHLIKEHHLRPEFARRKAAEMRPAHEVVIKAGDDRA